MGKLFSFGYMKVKMVLETFYHAFIIYLCYLPDYLQTQTQNYTVIFFYFIFEVVNDYWKIGD